MNNTSVPSQNITPRLTLTLLLAFALATILTLSTLLFTTQAHAVEMQEGTGDFEVNTSAATTVGFGGKEWVVIGHDGQGVAGKNGPLSGAGDGSITLLLKEGSRFTFLTTQFSDDNNCTYENSLLFYNMSHIYTSLLSNAAEKYYIVPRSLEASTQLSNDVDPDYLDTVYGTDPIASVYIWPLSTFEAETIDANIRHFDEEWWLRSGGDLIHRAATVGNDGTIDAGGLETNQPDNEVRPALTLALDAALFSSAADVATGKEAATAGNDLASLATTSGAVKFTLRDLKQNMELLATTAESTQSASVSDKLTFSYRGATTGENQFISCVLKDNASGDLLYYGKLAASSNAASGPLVLPLSGISDGNYTLMVFSEQANSALLTDFASTPVTMTLSVSHGVATVSNFGGTIEDPAPAPTPKLPETGDGTITNLVLVVILSAAFCGIALHRMRILNRRTRKNYR